MMKGADLPKDRALDSQLALSLIGKDAPHDLILSRDFVTRIGNLCDVAFLRKLNVSFNQIRSLDGIDQLPQLKQLLAYACDIDKIECLKLLPKIEMVMLQQNKISKMNDTFSGLAKLQELRLDQNKISKIEFLSGCVSLRKLDLSFNNIDSFTGLSGLQQLQELKISNNSIKTLAPLKALPSIKDLDVSNNQLKSIDGLQQMPTLEYVKADHNMISELKMSAAMGSNNKRAAPDSSKDKKQTTGNAKKSQDTAAVVELADTVGPMLVEITLSGNRIRSVEGLELFKATLESVDLSSNNLSTSELSSVVATFKQCTKLSELRMYMNPITAEEDTLRLLADQLTQACPALRALDGLSIVASTDPLAAKSQSQTAFHTWNDDASTVLDGRSLAGETLQDDATQQDDDNASEHASDVDSEEEREKAKEENTEVKRYPPNLMLQEMLTPEEIQAKEAEIRNGLKYCKDRLENATRSVFGFADEAVVEQPAFKARRLLSTTPSASGLRVAAALEEADAISKSSKFHSEKIAAKELSGDVAVLKTESRPSSTILKEKEKLVDRVRLAVSNSVKDFTSPDKDKSPSAAPVPVALRPLTSDSAPRATNTNASLLTDDVRASFNAQDLHDAKAESKTNSPQRSSQQVEGSPNSRAESKSVTSSTTATTRTKPSVAASFLLGVGPAPLGSGTTRYGTKVKAPSSKSRATNAQQVAAHESSLQSSLSIRSDVEALNILNLKITKPSQNVYMTEWESDAPAVAAPSSNSKAEAKQEYAAPVGSLESITSPFREYQEYATSDEEDADEANDAGGAYFAENNGYEDRDFDAKDYEMDMVIPAEESERDADTEAPVTAVPEPVYREVRLRPDDRFGKAVASHGGAGGFDVRGLRRGSEPLTPHSNAADDLRTGLQSREREIGSAGAGAGGAMLRRGFSEPKMDGPEAVSQIDNRDYKYDGSETPPLSPAGASVISLPTYRPVLLAPSAATATLLASNNSLSPRPAGPAVSATSQPKMRFKIPQSARNAINNPQSKDAHDSPTPSNHGHNDISALEQEVLRASRAALAKKQHNPVTPLVGAAPGPFSPRPDYK
eukprot:gene15284-17491_t